MREREKGGGGHSGEGREKSGDIKTHWQAEIEK